VATPTLLSVSNVALPNTADSGNVSVTAPTGANACVIGGTFYVGDNSVVTSLTGSQLTSTTNGALKTATPSGGNYMSSYAGAFQVTATGSQTIRLQKTGGYGEGPTCQIAWLTVDDPTDFVRTSGFLIDTQASSPDTLSVALASATTDLVLGIFGTDGSSSDPSAPSGTTQQGTLQTTQFDKSIVFSVDSPGASTTTITVGSRAYPTLIGISLKAGSGGPTNYSLTCDVGSYSLTGIAALLRRGYSVVANVGSYALTGQDAALRRGYSLVCSTGSYAITGYDATLTYVPGPTAYSLTCDVGSYSLTGYDATLTYGAGPTNYSLTCDVGAYSITGHDATLTYSAGAANNSLSCDVGAYVLTGIDATLTYTPGAANYTLTCDTGAYALAGVAATLSFGRRLTADTGSYAITGQAATLVYGRRLICATGAYSLTGQDATLTAVISGPMAYSLPCDTGSYSLSGGDAGLTFVEVDDIVLLGGGPGLPKKKKKRVVRTELDKDSYLYRLLSPEVRAQIEPEVAEVIEAKAVEVVEQKAKPSPKAVRVALADEGLAYRQAYKEIYLELIGEIRKAQEDEEEEEEAIAMALIL